jgi:hypothetical protein
VSRTSLAEHALFGVVFVKADVAGIVAGLAKGYAFEQVLGVWEVNKTALGCLGRWLRSRSAVT